MVAVVVPVTFLCSASTRSAFFHPCQHGQKSLLDDPQAVGRHVKARRTQRPRPQNPSLGWVNWPRNTGELRRRCPWCREFFLASAGLHDSTADSAFSWTPGGRRRTGRAASDRIIGPNDRLGDPIRCERRCFLWAPLQPYALGPEWCYAVTCSHAQEPRRARSRSAWPIAHVTRDGG